VYRKKKQLCLSSQPEGVYGCLKVISVGLVDELHASGSIYTNNHRPNPSLVFLHRDQLGEVRASHIAASIRSRSLLGWNSIFRRARPNPPSDRLLRPSRLPFTTLERAVISELRRFFRPKLIGRFDEKIAFKPLSQDTQREIGCLAISEELDRFKERGFNLTVSEAAFEFLVRRGIQKTLGARPMKKTVQKFIGDAIRESLAGTPPSGTLAVSPLNDGLTIQ
jgi:C-terminal, D2-small domain, of ClpB protein